MKTSTLARGLAPLAIGILALSTPVGSKALGQQGRTEEGQIFSPALTNNLLGDSGTRPFSVYLPPSYDSTRKRYPVVYALHRYGESHTDMVTALQPSLDSMTATRTIGEMIVVFVSGTNRLWGCQYLSSPVIGDYETYIAKDLVAYIDAHYRTLATRDSRGITGVSMGGWGAMHMALKFPDLFSVAVPNAGYYDAVGDVAQSIWSLSCQNPPTTLVQFDGLSFPLNWAQSLLSGLLPDLQRPELYSDYPYELVDERLVPVDSAQQRLRDGDVAHGDLGRYTNQPVRLKAIEIVHGATDSAAPISGARDFTNALAAAGIQFAYEEHDGGHVYVPELSLPFLSTNLQGAEPYLGPPVIIQQPQAQTNLVGTTAMFSVVASGALPLAYQWQRDNGSLAFYDLLDRTSANLVLTNVGPADAMNYRVIVSSIDGAVTSGVAKLTVVAPTDKSTVQFSATAYTIAESAATVTLVVQRTNDLNTLVAVDYTSTDGTATNGLKYTAVAGTLFFGTGEANKTIEVPILNEGFAEGRTFFQVALSHPSAGAALGARSNATVSIIDNDAGVQFVSGTYSVAEDAGSVQLAVMRGDDGTMPVSVDVVTSDLTGINGLDYTGLTNTLCFAAKEYFKVFSVPILNNNLKQPNRTFGVGLGNPVGLLLGPRKTTTVTILDNEPGFQFESATYSVAEDAGVARLNVRRGTDDMSSVTTVDYAVVDGTATNGLDFAATNGTLVFAPGERAKTLSIGVFNNGLKDGTRTFRVTLGNPTGRAGLGPATTATATVSILDNDSGVGFERSSYANAWSEPAITVLVLRGNDWKLGPIGVDYSTSDGSARAGIDYQAASGTLEFGPNESLKPLTISLLRNRAAEGTRSFSLNLSNPSGGAILGKSVTSLCIVGTYATLAPAFDPGLTIGRDGESHIVTWSGGGQLLRADRLTGPCQTLSLATSPCSIQSPLPTSFYRVANPRPVNFYVPTTYDGHTPMPLVILLSGTGKGSDLEAIVQFRPLAESRGFLYCYPDAAQSWNAFFWNSTVASILGYPYVDDSGFLRGLIEEVSKRFAVDRKRIFVAGQSGGANMAHRLARDSADLVAGIVSVAGSVMLMGGDITPCEPVNILQVHGTADSTMLYNDFVWPGTPYWFIPGAMHTIQIWAGYNGATGLVTAPAPSLDLTTEVPGMDTVVTRYTNAPPGGAIELWTINGVDHAFRVSSEFSPRIIDWLLAHPKQ